MIFPENATAEECADLVDSYRRSHPDAGYYSRTDEPMPDGPYARSSASGSAWPQGHPGELEWTQDELNSWIVKRMIEDPEFHFDWLMSKIEAHSYPVRTPLWKRLLRPLFGEL